ncbi:MAG: YfiR family protein [Chthoniobacterales bacterium]
MASVVLFASASSAWAVSDTDLKVAYLFNFASLVNWPASSFGSPQSPIVIGFAGDDAMANQLERRIGNRTAKGRPIQVRRVSSADGAAIRDCHLLYVGDGERGRLDAILREIQRAPVLTVSDGNDFVRHGGIIAFEVQDKTVRFTANTRSANSSGISLGSDVLRLAREVISK